jgi:hypothetical protein
LYGLNANNSDLINLNGLWWGDVVGDAGDGLNFVNGSNWDRVYSVSGVLKYQPNVAKDAAIGGYTVWHSGNDGTGSTLDADLLDGQHGSYYATAGHTHGIITSTGYIASAAHVLISVEGGLISSVLQSNAFNRAFGTTHTTVAYGDHAHTGVYAPAYAGIRQVTANGSLVNTDNNKIVYVSGAYTLSIPNVDNGEFVIGTQITIISATASTVTIDPVTDVYINGATASITISIPYRAITLVMYATDYWFAIGVV